MRLEILLVSSRCLIFVNQPDFLLATSSLKALRKLQCSFTESFLKHLYFKVNMGKKVEVSVLFKTFWSLEFPQLSKL